MRTQSRTNPGDMPSFWEMNRSSLGDTEAAFRAWFEMSGRAREQATKFMNSRWAKDTAALAELGQCRTPIDALSVQVSYLAGAYADYMSEGQRIAGFFGDMVRESLPGMSVAPVPSTTSKAKHRVGTH